MKFAYLIEPPFNFLDVKGRATGCDVELARHVFGELGIADHDFVQTEFANLLPGLGDGRWRMTTGLFATDERRAHARFSRPIWALPDGLLVKKGNPHALTGYKSAAESKRVRMAVIRDQIQHRTAVENGVPEERIAVFDTYVEAAKCVRDGIVDAYASVGRAHSAFIEQHGTWGLDSVTVPHDEKPSAFGSFAFRLNDDALARDVDAVLAVFLGSAEHRAMVAPFGFSDADVDLIVG